MVKAQEQMEDGHKGYVRGITVLGVVALSSAALVYFSVSAFMQALTHPSTAATLDLTWLEFASVLLLLGGLYGLIQFYFGIHKFMRGTRKALDSLVTMRGGPGTREHRL